MKPLGLLTIGQAPRDDVVPEIRSLLPADVEIIQAGALDGLSSEEIAHHRPTQGTATVVTRLADGREVMVDKGFVHQRIQELAGRLADETSAIGLLCSGSFPSFPCSVPFIVPNRLLQGVLPNLEKGKALGVIVPSEQQIQPAVDELLSWGVDAVGRAVSPYTESHQVGRAAEELARLEVSALLMHCFGYDLNMRNAARRAYPGPIVLIRSLFARVLAEFLS